MVIYKYIDDWGVEILAQRRIKLSHPKDFNDPFEFLPTLKRNFSDAELESKFYDPAYRENYYLFHCFNGGILPRTAFLQWMDNNKARVLRAMRITYETQDYTPEAFRENAGEKFAVTCFSEKPDNPLMWAHYADEHRGLVIGIERDYFGPLIYEVEYTSKRVEYSPLLTTGRGATIMAALRSKDAHWAYEEEHRAIIPYPLCINDGSLWFYTIDAPSIKEVILGARASTGLKQSVRSLIVDDLAHIRLFNARLSTEDYGLVVEPE